MVSVSENPIDSPPDIEAVGEDMSSGVTEAGSVQDMEGGGDGGGPEGGILRKSWVLCDDCKKWRCIPVELADLIDSTNARWSCRDNPNPHFADCSIPQEKTNAEINAELQISDASDSDEEDERDGVESKLRDLETDGGDNKPAVWKLIRRNIFKHRKAKSQTSDEIMVCQCTPPEGGGVGCVDNCLNRMLNIECVKEHCPCGEACSNQQFQKRLYSKVETFRCGKKGFGLKVLKNVPKDSFLIEYVGEVLDVSAFEQRQQEYARNGQKHFYFMTLSSTEVIDACSKGNLGRFINHSCEPNCKTEKWMVNGEVCIGLFAIRDIMEGEEVTFDYNYVRVRGASAKKCECGSLLCRGFIGADSDTPKDAIVESDSDEEEDPEPIMVANSDEEDECLAANRVSCTKKERDDAVYCESNSPRPKRIKRKLVPVKEKGSVSLKRAKMGNGSRKNGLTSSRGLTAEISSGRHENGRTLASDVQEKLDDLLDKAGGLRKRKDVVADYLKLLVQSVASGDNKKAASACSVRDVSLLLEALLRTSSRSVLSDIIKMNGLRMLHTFITQLRKQWDKTPILRKLMKVLDFLSSDRVHVLTQDMINSAAPSRGMESFSESLYELTRHKDPEVYQMARRFRSKWISSRPFVLDQHSKGADKPQATFVKSVSPVETSTLGNSSTSPRKQSPMLRGAECAEIHSGSSAQPVVAGPPSTQSGSVLTDETTIRPSPVGVLPYNSLTVEPEKAENNKRKRVSRWDAPTKIMKGTYVSLTVGNSVVTPAANFTPQGGSGTRQVVGAESPEGKEQRSKKSRQDENGFGFCSNGPPLRGDVSSACRSGKQETGEESRPTPAQPGSVPLQNPWHLNQSGHPSGHYWHIGASGKQDLACPTFIATNGQSQFYPGYVPGLPFVRPDQGFVIPGPYMVPQPPGTFMFPPPIPFNGPTPLGNGPPTVQHLVHHSANGAGMPIPGMPCPGRPSPHVGPGGPIGQNLHVMASSIPVVCPQGVHFGTWCPPANVPHFSGGPAFPSEDARKALQPPGLPSNGGFHSETGAERSATSGEGLPNIENQRVNSMQGGGKKRSEPPVPGMSPPPSATSNTNESIGVTGHGLEEPCKEPKLPLESLELKSCGDHASKEVPEVVRSREQVSGTHNAGVTSTRESLGPLHPDQWENPESKTFRDDVYHLVKSRVKKHKLRSREVEKLCTKMADVIVRKEVAKFKEQRSQGIEKIIVRSKLVEKVDSYVHNQVEQFSRKIHRSGELAR